MVVAAFLFIYETFTTVQKDKKHSMSEKTIKETPKELATLDFISDLLDSRFRIPGTEIRFGLDSLVGLIPYVGDLTTFGVSGAMIVSMVKHGASGMLVVRMLWNVLIDTLFGAIPFLGDIFDFRFRANRKNFELLKEHYEEGKHEGSATWIIVLLIVFLIVLFSAMIWAVWKIAAFSLGLLMSVF